MSQSDIINDSTTGWNTVRSKNFIKNCSRPNSPVIQIPNSPVLQSASPTFPVNQDAPHIFNDTPPNSKNTNPVVIPNSNPTSHEASKTIQIINSSSDPWQNMLDFSRMSKSIIDNQINYLSYELQFPLWLRGKSPLEKDCLSNNTIYLTIDKILIGMKDEFMKIYKYELKTTDAKKITDIIIKNLNINEKLNLISNLVDLSKKIKEVCEIEFATSDEIKTEIKTVVKTIKSNTEKTNTSNTDQTTNSNTDKTTSSNPKEEVSNSDVTKKFSYDERVEHKKALITAQEKFFETCILSNEKVIEFKENINSLKDWSGTVNTVNLSNDEIKIDNYTFSKKHFLKNSWFRNRLMEKYCNLFEFQEIFLVLPSGKSNLLIIEGSKLI